jgi:drug/metabolite transporter (DMT)-like permease
MTLALILVSVGLAAAAQLTLKYGMTQVGFIRGAELSSPLGVLIKIFRHPAIWAGLMMFGLSAAAWLIVLSRTALSFAYPFASLTYVIILVFDWLVIKEPVFALRWVGVALIISGLIFVSRTGQA